MFLILVLALEVLNTPLANAKSCKAIYVDKEFRIDFAKSLPSEVVEALAKINVQRPGLLTRAERDQFNLDSGAVRLVIGPAMETPNKPGILVDPASRGTTNTSVDPSLISLTKSERLFEELQESATVGDFPIFLRKNRDHGVLQEFTEKGIAFETMRDRYAKVEDGIFIEKYVEYLTHQTGISESQQDYVRTALHHMAATSRLVQGPSYQKKINGIRIRWKGRGKGADHDTVHTDHPDTSIATTLTLIGAGTEVFYQSEGNTLEVRGVQTNYISNILGESSGHPAVKHRASTLDGPRIVILMFWN